MGEEIEGGAGPLGKAWGTAAPGCILQAGAPAQQFEEKFISPEENWPLL
jgi:hypothetical protein